MHKRQCIRRVKERARETSRGQQVAGLKFTLTVSRPKAHQTAANGTAAAVYCLQFAWTFFSFAHYHDLNRMKESDLISLLFLKVLFCTCQQHETTKRSFVNRKRRSRPQAARSLLLLSLPTQSRSVRPRYSVQYITVHLICSYLLLTCYINGCCLRALLLSTFCRCLLTIATNTY